MTRRLGGPVALDRGGREAFHEDRAHELHRRGVAGPVGDHLDGHPERPERVGEGARARSGGEGRRAEAARGHRAEQRHVGEARADERCEIALQLRRGGVQVCVDGVASQGREGRRAAPSATAAVLTLRTTSVPATALSASAARRAPGTSRAGSGS